MPRARAIALAAALLLAACGSRPTALVRPDVPLADADLVTGWASDANRSASSYAEQLVVRMRFEDGGSAYVRLLITNVAGASGRAAVKANVRVGDGPRLDLRVEKDAGAWQFGRDRFDVTVGDCRLVGGVGRGEVVLAGEGFRLRVALTSALPPVRPAGGMADFGGGNRYVTTIILPRATVDGELVVAGEGGAERTVPLRGTAYMEHRLGTIAPYAMARRWYNVRAQEADATLIASAFQRTERLGGRTQGWIYYATDDALVLYEGDLVLEPQRPRLDAETGYAVPQLLELSGRTVDFEGVVRADTFQERIDDLKSLSKMERFVVERLMRPFTFRYGASYLLKVPADGGEPRSLGGEARFDFQQLND